jgi:hypothetical protein
MKSQLRVRLGHVDIGYLPRYRVVSKASLLLVVGFQAKCRDDLCQSVCLPAE